ncbi:MAG: phosphatidate cytidylyltransferase [Nitrospira sp.]|jgi:phosphatidate cytidylyltransferase|nr:phosphatidate cytidylyltransferase [Nitrospira sp.]MBS0160415.1 phosphatidate cytidylyltransferase [Nitrospira sp.]MCC7471583.1 phosphatidate cytidylyltransferase [Candidatus Nomurabacteria bacterium]HMZ56790.1 phosphatidate cytidylyltransferase [Nitrospira sp.]HNK14035.1 phosphatidate cytidylyltransferase [Nitrospira sp.]
MPPPLDHARPRSSSETIRRVLAAVVFVPIFFFLVRDLGPVAFFVLVVISGMFAVGEFYRLHVGPASWPWWGWAGVAFTGLFLGSTQWPGLLSERTVLAGTLSSALCMPLFSGKPLKDSLLDGMVLIMGVLYVGLSLGYLLLTRAQPDGTMLIFFVVLVTWAGDTGAYIAGKSLGRHALAPIVSPKKTYEGLAGGIVLACLAAVVARAWFLPRFSLVDCLALGLLLTIAGLIGDLAESAMKRHAGFKDSGALIPGHGGMLDRLDSLLFTGPAFYYYVAIVANV